MTGHVGGPRRLRLVRSFLLLARSHPRCVIARSSPGVSNFFSSLAVASRVRETRPLNVPGSARAKLSRFIIVLCSSIRANVLVHGTSYARHCPCGDKPSSCATIYLEHDNTKYQLILCKIIFQDPLSFTSKNCEQYFFFLIIDDISFVLSLYFTKFILI